MVFVLWKSSSLKVTNIIKRIISTQTPIIKLHIMSFDLLYFSKLHILLIYYFLIADILVPLPPIDLHLCQTSVLPFCPFQDS